MIETLLSYLVCVETCGCSHVETQRASSVAENYRMGKRRHFQPKSCNICGAFMVYATMSFMPWNVHPLAYVLS